MLSREREIKFHGISVGWPSGLRRQFKALVSSEAWVRIPLQSLFFSPSLIRFRAKTNPSARVSKLFCGLVVFGSCGGVL